MSWVQRYWLRSGCILALLGLACLVLPIFASPALAATPAKKPAPKTPADKKAADEAHKHALDKLKAENLDIVKTPGEFIVSLAKDHQGNIWVGTEDLGVFRFSPNAEANQQWRQFTTKDGLAARLESHS